MTRDCRVGVVSRAETFAQVQMLVAVVQAGLGSQAPVFVDSTVCNDTDRLILQRRWPQVTFLDGLLSGDTSGVPGALDYVLVVPGCVLVGLSGVVDTVGLMEEQPDVLEVGGLLVDLGTGIAAVGLVDVGGENSLGPTYASFDLLYPDWLAWGQFAFSQVDAVGGLVLVRRDGFHHRHLAPVPHSVTCLASAIVNPVGSSVIYTGLGLVADGLVSGIHPETGAACVVPGPAREVWQTKGVSQASVVHRGTAVADDDRNVVVFLADNRILAVDSRGLGEPVSPTHYFGSAPDSMQWGAGFGMWVAFFGSHSGAGSLTGWVSGPGLSPTEKRVVDILRRLVSRLPARLFGLLKRVLTR